MEGWDIHKDRIMGCMRQRQKITRCFLRDTSGVSAMEYALLGALIAVLLVGSLTSIGTKVAAYFTSLSALFK